VSTVGGANGCSSPLVPAPSQLWEHERCARRNVEHGGPEWPAAGSAGELARLGRLDEGRWPLAVFLGPAVVADPWRVGDESALISETLISQARGARVASVSSLAWPTQI
jgi:hypothetical protein